MLQPVRIDAFPGLRLIDQGVADVVGALDILNTSPPQRGILGRRKGHELQCADALTVSVEGLAYSGADAAGHLLCGGGTEAAAVTLGGTVDDTQAISNGDGFSFTDFGAPAGERSYMSNGADLIYWDGSAFQVPTVTYNGTPASSRPKPRAVCSTPWDNRFMACGFAASNRGPGAMTVSEHHVIFSDTGDPDTYNSLWYEILSPGDGEKIVAAVRWRNYAFVFKQTKFFVFYGTQTGAGTALFFNYFTVDTGVGAHGPRGVVAGRDGVYFMSRQGIYVTTGEDVKPIAEDLDPLWSGVESPFFSGEAMSMTALDEVQLSMVGEQLVVNYPTGSENRQLVSDVRFGGWTYWNLAADAICSVPVSGNDRLWFANGTDLHKQGEAADDDGTSIVAFWQGPWETYALLGEKTIRSTRLFGSGQGRLGYAADYGTVVRGGNFNIAQDVDLWADGTDPADLWADGSDAADQWGGGVTFDDAWIRDAERGTVLSTRIQNLAGSDFSVQWLEHHLADIREESRDSRAART